MHPNVPAYRLPTVRQSYLLSGKATYCQAKLPTVRQATYCQASYLLSGMHPNVAAYFAPNNRIQTTYTVRQATYYQASYLLSGMHPNVAAYFAPTNRIHAPNRP